jgi:DNA-binding CsgD family transcriptional regulator
MKLLNQLGDAHLRCGRWDEALAELDEAADISALMGDAGGGRSDLAWLQAVRGDVASARAQIALEAPLVPEDAHLWRIQHLARAGLVEICAGRWADATHLLEEARSIADVVGLFEAAPIPFGQDLVEALLKVGRVDAADVEAQHLVTAARQAGLPLPLALASRSIALVHSARSEHAAGIASVMAAIDIHADVDDPFHWARTELAAGDVLRRGGRRADARRHFDLALQMFEELGATSFSRAARAGLDRVATRTTVQELTETERRVAELAAAGRSNTEISGEMFIAVRTVESNLTRVYRKLGVRSRSQLAGALTPRS